MKAWIKGAIIGFFIPIIGFVIALGLSTILPKSLYFLGIIFMIPMLIGGVPYRIIEFISPSDCPDCGFIIFYIAPIVWIVIGAVIGYLYGKRRKMQLTKVKK